MNYQEKFNISIQNTTYFHLDAKEQNFIKHLAYKYLLTFQEIKIISEIIKDLSAWNENYGNELLAIFNSKEKISKNPKDEKKHMITTIKQYYENLKQSEKIYSLHKGQEVEIKNLKCIQKDTESNIFGSCPVYSEKTICCGLKTLDVVQNCPFNCSYCTIQTFYGDDFIFINNLKAKLSSLNLDKQKFYHIGTGQSSDALVWGNKYGILDDLIAFAKEHNNVLLEFKTKSSNIKYFETTNIPNNIVCSWSLNPQRVIDNEELGTASLIDRLEAACKISKLGIKVAFHFHPMIYYKGWESEYKEIADYIQKNIDPKNISFISFGSLTFIKPVIKQIREKKIKTKILQMPTSFDPNGKITYPTELKIKLYKTIYNYFQNFHDKTYFYLCMETREIWNNVFGFCYENNEKFLEDFIKKTLYIIP